MKRLSLRAAACATLVLAAGLAGCVPAALVGGAVGAGALLMTADRRSGETQEADRTIEAAAGDAVVRALPGRGHVNITSYYRKVLITGEVPSEEARSAIGERVGKLDGIKEVFNETTVGPASSLTTRSNDSYITSKVKARLVDEKTLSANHVKVVTESGTVFLMGIVGNREAKVAVQITRTTDGVRKVVNLFEVVSDAEIKRMSTLPTSNSSPADQPAPVESR